MIGPLLPRLAAPALAAPMFLVSGPRAGDCYVPGGVAGHVSCAQPADERRV